MKKPPSILFHLRYLGITALALGLFGLTGCEPQKKGGDSDDTEDCDSSDDKDCEDNKTDDDNGSDETSSGDKKDSTSEEDSKSKSESKDDTGSSSKDEDNSNDTGPKADCKLAPLTTIYPDTNPTSPTFKKRLGPKDFQGGVTLWTIAFDCNC